MTQPMQKLRIRKSLDIKLLITDCCGLKSASSAPMVHRIDALVEEFKRRRMFPICEAGVRKWIERRQIPSDRLIELLEIAQMQGWKLNLYDYLVSALEPPPPTPKPIPKPPKDPLAHVWFG